MTKDEIIKFVAQTVAWAVILWIYGYFLRKQVRDWRKAAEDTLDLARFRGHQLIAALTAVEESHCAKTQKKVLEAMRPVMSYDEKPKPIPIEQPKSDQ